MTNTSPMIRNRRSSVDFIGIGMVKCGTSWMGKVLAEHPEVSFTRQTSSKEIKFFNKPYNYQKGLDWYLSQFPADAPGKIRGEFTPAYMMDPDVARLIHESFPDTKLLAVLRKPWDMLYALYWDRLVSPWYDIDYNFADAIRSGRFDKVDAHFGRYHQLLLPFYQLFPRENILVVLLDDIARDPPGVVKRLYKFLDIDDRFRPASLTRRINEGVILRSDSIHRLAQRLIRSTRKFGVVQAVEHAPIWNEIIYHGYRYANCKPMVRPRCPEDVCGIFMDYYDKDIQHLGALIGREMSDWARARMGETRG